MITPLTMNSPAMRINAPTVSERREMPVSQ